MAKTDDIMKCETCEENGKPQPEFFWKRTLILSTVDRWGKYTKGAVPAKKQVAYLCPVCDDIVRLLVETNASAASHPGSHPDDDDV